MTKKKSKKTASKKSSTNSTRKRPPTAAGKVALQGTVAKTVRKGQLRHVAWNSVDIEAVNPLFGRHFVVGQNIMLARVLLKKGCMVPEHSHPNEQLTFIAEGALKFWIDGKEIVVNAGEVLTIPPNMPHKAEALEDTIDFDIFNPPRADWMTGTDVYLR